MENILAGRFARVAILTLAWVLYVIITTNIFASYDDIGAWWWAAIAALIYIPKLIIFLVLDRKWTRQENPWQKLWVRMFFTSSAAMILYPILFYLLLQSLVVVGFLFK